MRERIKAPPAEEVVEYLFRPRALTSPGRDFRILLRINRAHVVMLVRQDLMTPEHAEALLRVLSELEADGVESLPFDPGLEDAYLNMEHAIIQKSWQRHRRQAPHRTQPQRHLRHHDSHRRTGGDAFLGGATSVVHQSSPEQGG